VRKKHYSKVTI